jgi:hypothetical protein
MKDAELRGKMLKVFYDRRHNAQGWVPTSEMEFSSEEMVDRKVVGTVGRQLADGGLIRWKPLMGSQEGFVLAMAQITALGVDVVEGTTQSPINIVFQNATTPAQPQTTAPVTGPLPADPEPRAEKGEPEILTLKPSVYGISIDLKALYRRLQKTFRN